MIEEPSLIQGVMRVATAAPGLLASGDALPITGILQKHKLNGIESGPLFRRKSPA
jgi:hypothetical protein